MSPSVARYGFRHQSRHVTLGLRLAAQSTAQRGVACQAVIEHYQGQIMRDSEESTDFAKLDDSALLAVRASMRTELERLPPHSRGHAALSARYDLSTQEIDARARDAWANAN